MTDGPVADTVPARAAGGPARPQRPPRSRAVLAGVVGAFVLTAVAVSDQLGIGFNPIEVVRNIAGAERVVSELLSPSWANFDRTLGPFLETLQIAVIAAPTGCAVALLVAFLASRVTTPGAWTLRVSRSVMSVVRSIPDILYALVFVAAFSIGPLAGILALFMFNIGVVAKLTSESVDAVDPGPIEAADAAGATIVQRVRTAVFPQVLPNYLAYALYTFELNLRASLVIGLVGAGGIGQLLNVARNAYRYDVISLLVVEIFVIVLVVESISIALRRRLV